MKSSSEATDVWIFGYGSLIWKPPPHYDSRVAGWVEGYVRRFWQSSEDHRGTPTNPGRVVTLISQQFYALLDDPSPEPAPEESHSGQGGRVWGAAYHIPKEHAKEVLEYLDIREQGGYSLEQAVFFPASSDSTSLGDVVGSSRRAEAVHLSNPSEPGSFDDTPFICLVYIGLPSNPQFLGPQDPEALAKHILSSEGPSGKNREYLYELDHALKALSPGVTGDPDNHVRDLVARCQRLEAGAG